MSKVINVKYLQRKVATWKYFDDMLLHCDSLVDEPVTVYRVHVFLNNVTGELRFYNDFITKLIGIEGIVKMLNNENNLKKK